MYYTDDGINQTESTVGVFCQVPKASLRYDSPKFTNFRTFLNGFRCPRFFVTGVVYRS